MKSIENSFVIPAQAGIHHLNFQIYAKLSGLGDGFPPARE
jgi:hypothetical protein